MARPKRGGGKPSSKTSNYNRRAAATVPRKRKNTSKNNITAKRAKFSPKINNATPIPVLPTLPSVAPSRSQTDANGNRIYNLSQRKPMHEMNDLVGIDEIQHQILHSIIGPFVITDEKANALKMSRAKGLLLTGVPGTGKTVLADGIVNEINKLGKKVNFFHETGACLSQWVGESESNLRTLFRTANDHAPSVIFFDEIDGLGRTRGDPGSPSGSSTTMATFLTEINNIEPGRVLLIAATNCLQQCDPALIRKGRFDLTIKMPVPNDAGREKILAHYLNKKDLPVDEKDMSTLVLETNGWTGADLKTFVDSLHVAVLDKMFPDLAYISMSLDKIKMTLKTQTGKMMDMKKFILPQLREFKKTA